MTSRYYREPDGKTFPQLEEEVMQAWSEQDMLSLVNERMRAGSPMVFCEGPPTANAKPHMGHAFNRVVKDAFLRYHVMNGRKIVPHIGGWDCHGLPVEIEVERSLGISGKKAIESLGVAEFNRLCRESVIRYRADWETMSRRIGYWLDYEHAYMTMSREYIESVWWSLKQLHSKGLLKKDRKVLPYCPRCSTTLSAHEVALGFRETEDRYLVVKFKLVDSDSSLLVWTPVPWTLVANGLVAVDRERSYLAVEHSGERLILAEDAAPQYASGDKVIGEMSGGELVGRKYTPPFDYHDFSARGFKVVHSPETSKEGGTGIMSVTPAYGSVDYELGTAEGLELFDPVDDEGRFTSEVPELEGRLAHDTNSDIMRLLESKGLLFRWGVLKHSYPFCWRCDTALIYKVTDSWFVRTSERSQDINQKNDEIRWAPESFKHGRFGNFLLDIKDWAVSRTRYWGTPLPVWRCPQGHETCVGSMDELESLSIGTVSEGFDPHRPYVDEVSLKCPDCGQPMTRERHVIDFWYDSGCAPFAQYHYPFDNIEEVDTHRSVDFIAEGVDQTRGWFYTQLAIGTMLFEKPAYLSVLVLGHVLDTNGVKMSRLSGNAIYPDQVFTSVGADATRLYLLSNPVWEPVEFSEEKVRATMVGALTTLINVYAFFSSNANAYGFKEGHQYTRTHDLDRWIASRLNSTAKEARAGFDALEPHRTVEALERFIADLSGWYVRRSRRRFWEENDPQDRFSAHATLYECLLELSKLMAPVTPFFADWMYLSLHGRRRSVHLEDYPFPDESQVNRTLERQMSLVISAVEAGRLARQKVNIKLRQPLKEAVIASDPNRMWTLRRFEKMISEELNVKKVECIESRDKMVQFALAPDLRVLGPKLKEGAGEVSQLLAKVDENELVRHLKEKGKVRLGGFDLTEEDVIVSEKEKPGYSHASVGDLHVYISLDVTQNLKLEGLSREVIRRIQHMRKELRLDFEELVDVEYSGHHDIEVAISVHQAHILSETHARALQKNQVLEGAQKWVINKMPLMLKVTKSSR